MEHSEGASTPARQRLCVYIDGFNLYHGIKSKGGRKWLWLDLVKLAEKLKPQSEVTMVKYFTANVINEPEAKARQAHYLHALQARYRDRIQIFKGRYQQKSKRCPTCGTWFQFPEEKETDVSIAVHIVTDALQGNYEAALVISADSDLSPAVKMVQQERSRYFISAAFPPDRFSEELRKLMPASFQIYPQRLRQSLLPDEFEDGLYPRRFERPSKWH